MPYLNGNIVVPPNCPQHTVGPPIPDLGEASFDLGVHTTSNRPEPIVEAFASFTVGDPEGDDGSYSCVETEGVTESVDSPLGKQLLRFTGIKTDGDESESVDPKTTQQAERIRQVLCNRVAACRGLIRGKCWALGEDGFRETLAKVLPPNSED